MSVYVSSPTFGKSDKGTSEKENYHPVFTQVGTLQSLLNGNFDGTKPVSDLRTGIHSAVVALDETSHQPIMGLTEGATGVGTFDKINGEMVAIDDTIYQCLADGSVVADPTTTTPFATIAEFVPHITEGPFDFDSPIDMSALTRMLDRHCHSEELVMFKIVGEFRNITYRSETPSESGRQLEEVMKTHTVDFSAENISGTLICVYSTLPEVGEGFQYHFISDDRTKGGHVTGFQINHFKTTMCVIGEKRLELSV